jgi:hypothetical protein
MKLGTMMGVPILLATLVLHAVPIRVEDEAKKKSSEPSKPADAVAAAQKVARTSPSRQSSGR